MRFDGITRGCERAIVTAYLELRELGASDLYSFQACTTLYRIHHPRASSDEAHRLVAEWIDRQLVEDDRSPNRRRRRLPDRSSEA